MDIEARNLDLDASETRRFSPSLPQASEAIKADPLLPKRRNHFSTAIFCALTLEANAVEAAFDHHLDAQTFGKAQGDANAYSTGMIGRHAVVLVWMAGMGKWQAASSASACALSFPEIKLALAVGICGGVPFVKHDKEMLFGDAAISGDGLVHYDFGRQFPGHQFVRKDSILDIPGKPKAEISAFLSKLRGHRANRHLHDSMWTHLLKLQEDLGEPSTHPGAKEYKLFEPSYCHMHQVPGSCEVCGDTSQTGSSVCEAALTSTCEEVHCDSRNLMSRKRLVHPRPMVHFGLIASGDRVMKSGEDRDIIAKSENIIAFEMEGIGVWDQFPCCLVINGICDYADSHKSKRWQGYAAATAAACTKALLEQWMGSGSRSGQD
ncbi:nucleoside phosphorylase domain-containing protein [Podospora appendiculata]|uniref:Nucleoside phosphorylase domain-containing protein n=1 Tax=Podospora appendiculata TaxID=314037 RepID=A0AAE0XJY0_9PEZI|nr:nucleoside phosphorylase domain-containing protein [Podospora appendiculata]